MNKINNSTILGINSNQEKTSNHKIIPGKFKIVSKFPNSNCSNSILEKDTSIILEDNIKIKANIQKLMTEVAFYRSEYLKAETDLKQKEKYIEEILVEKNKDNSGNANQSMSTINMFNPKNKENNILTLKKQMKEMGQIVKEKEIELDKMKKSVKTTKINELLVENRTLNEELLKIKSLYDNSLMNSILNDKISEKSPSQQLDTIENQNKLLKKKEKNKKLKEEIKLLNNQIVDKEKLISSIEDNKNKLLKKKEKGNKLKSELKERKEDIEKLISKLNELENEIRLEKESKAKIIENSFKDQVLNKEIEQKTINSFQSQINELNKDVEYYKDLSDKREKLLNDFQEKQLKNIKHSQSQIQIQTLDNYQTLANQAQLKTEMENLKKTLEEYKSINELKDKTIVDFKNKFEEYKSFNDIKDKTIDDFKNKFEEYKSVNEIKDKTIEELKKEQENLISKLNDIKSNNEIISKADPKNGLIIRSDSMRNHIHQVAPKINQENLEVDLLYTEEQFAEYTYLLSKSFEANNIKVSTIHDNIKSGIDFKMNIKIFQEKITDNIMTLLRNKNSSNKFDLLIFIKSFFKIYDSNIKNFNSKFSGLFNTITSYSEESITLLNEQLKSLLQPFYTRIDSEIKKLDPDKTGYITFFSLRKMIEDLEIQFDEDLMEYFIFTLKSYDDSNSNFRDLKYENVMNLLDRENIVIEAKKENLDLNDKIIMLTDEEFKIRSDKILIKIAGVLFSKDTTVKKIFNETFVIGDKDEYYIAMNFQIFLKIMQEEMFINLDSTDMICIFNRLKNESNIQNIETVDIDKLAIEMEAFGIKELNSTIDIIEKIEKVDKFDKIQESPEEYIQDTPINDVKEKDIDPPKFVEQIYIEKSSKENNPIDLVEEIKQYNLKNSTKFSELGINSHPAVIKQNNEENITLQSLIDYLFFKFIISTRKKEEIKFPNDIFSNIKKDTIDLKLLCKKVEEGKESNDNSLRNSKKLSKFSKIASRGSNIEIFENEIERQTIEDAKELTIKLLSGVLLKLNQTVSNEGKNFEILDIMIDEKCFELGNNNAESITNVRTIINNGRESIKNGVENVSSNSDNNNITSSIPINGKEDHISDEFQNEKSVKDDKNTNLDYENNFDDKITTNIKNDDIIIKNREPILLNSSTDEARKTGNLIDGDCISDKNKIITDSLKKQNSMENKFNKKETVENKFKKQMTLDNKNSIKLRENPTKLKSELRNSIFNKNESSNVEEINFKK